VLGAIVEPRELLQVVWVSLVAGIAVTAIFSLALLGSARSAELRRNGREAGAVAYGALAVVAGLAFLAGVVLAVKLLIGR